MEALGAEIDGVGFNATGIAFIAQINIVLPCAQVKAGAIAEGDVLAAVGVVNERLAADGHVVEAGRVEVECVVAIGYVLSARRVDAESSVADGHVGFAGRFRKERLVADGCVRTTQNAAGTGGAGRAGIALRPLGTVHTGRTLGTVHTGRTLVTGIAFGSLGTVHTGRSLGTVRTGGAGRPSGNVGGAELPVGVHHDEGAIIHTRAGNSRHVDRRVGALDAEIDGVGFNAANIAFIAQINIVISGGQVITGAQA